MPVSLLTVCRLLPTLIEVEGCLEMSTREMQPFEFRLALLGGQEALRGGMNHLLVREEENEDEIVLPAVVAVKGDIPLVNIGEFLGQVRMWFAY